MPSPVVTRPASGRRIYLANVKASSAFYLLRGSRLRENSVTLESNGDLALPATRLAQLVDTLAHDRGRCVVLLMYQEDGFCTVACRDAREDTVNECVCVCGGVWHGVGSVAGRLVPNTDGLIRASGQQFVRKITVRRGGPDFRAALRTTVRQPH